MYKLMARHRNGGKLVCIQNKGSVLPLQYKNIKVRFALGETGTFHGAEIYEDVDGVTLGVNFTFVFDRVRHLVVGERRAMSIGCLSTSK
ncbi:hypothetical protein AVEN_57678-1 [Araneus ventricosus]|uniref:Uncharacterized protein n=1 Tax=Araneus ventricosus TaxID=182803 RepID=A0A4Y2P8Q5_ARAVE|nr:hypothetical protein AVEN_57678-1 [Araneus ventricosus]